MGASSRKLRRQQVALNIEELATTLLAKPCTTMSQEDIDAGWSTGGFVRHMSGEEIVEFFAKHNIPARIVGEGVLNYDSTQDLPHYDSLAQTSNQ